MMQKVFNLGTRSSFECSSSPSLHRRICSISLERWGGRRGVGGEIFRLEGEVHVAIAETDAGHRAGLIILPPCVQQQPKVSARTLQRRRRPPSCTRVVTAYVPHPTLVQQQGIRMETALVGSPGRAGDRRACAPPREHRGGQDEHVRQRAYKQQPHLF